MFGVIVAVEHSLSIVIERLPIIVAPLLIWVTLFFHAYIVCGVVDKSPAAVGPIVNEG